MHSEFPSMVWHMSRRIGITEGYVRGRAALLPAALEYPVRHDRDRQKTQTGLTFMPRGKF